MAVSQENWQLARKATLQDFVACFVQTFCVLFNRQQEEDLRWKKRSRIGTGEQVFEAHAAEIFEEAENRLHAQKAVLVTLLKD